MIAISAFEELITLITSSESEPLISLKNSKLRQTPGELTLDPNYRADDKVVEGEHQVVREHRYVRIWVDLLVFGLHDVNKIDRHIVDRVKKKSDEVQNAVVDIQADTAFALKIQEDLRVKAQ